MVEEDNSVRKSPGPHGLGDPNDTFLRKVESEILIPKRVRDISRTEKCTLEVAEFNNCAKEAGLKAIVTCQAVNKKMKECLGYWFYNPEFRQQVTEEYLKERAEFRATGISKKHKEFMTSQNQPNPA